MMCSRLEDISSTAEEASTTVTTRVDGSVCMKCQERAVTIARTKDPFCLSCFDVYFTHRFRATLGKERLIRPQEKVIMAFSGGESSRVLLHLLEEGLSENATKRLQFIPLFVYIDEGVALGHSEETCRDLIQEVLSIMSQTQFEIYTTTLEEVFGQSRVWSPRDNDKLKTFTAGSETCTAGSETATSTSQASTAISQTVTNTSDVTDVFTEGREKLKSIFTSLQSLTAKENMLLSLRRQLLVNIATKLNIKKILVGDNATSLSVKLLTNIAQGRGGAIPLDTAFCDDRRTDAMILRPLREFPVSEILSYVNLHKLDVVTVPFFTSSEGAPSNYSSITQLTTSFVENLQSNFPSTTSTIFRISNKLKINEALVSSDKCCLLCQAPCEVAINEEVFSHVHVMNDIEKKLCYGCRLTLKDSNCKDVIIDCL